MSTLSIIGIIIVVTLGRVGSFLRGYIVGLLVDKATTYYYTYQRLSVDFSTNYGIIAGLGSPEFWW